MLLPLLCSAQSLSRVRFSATPWTVARQAPLSGGFSRQEYWTGLPCPSLGDLANPGIKPRSPLLQADSLRAESPGKPKNTGAGSLSFLHGNFRPRDWTGYSALRVDSLTSWAPWEALLPLLASSYCPTQSHSPLLAWCLSEGVSSPELKPPLRLLLTLGECWCPGFTGMGWGS